MSKLFLVELKNMFNKFDVKMSMDYDNYNDNISIRGIIYK